MSALRPDTIVGHGRRRKQAHDDQHDWIWVRRGRCPPCKKTFTVLPDWSPPSGHYSYEVPPDRRGMRVAKGEQPRRTAGTPRDCRMIPRSGAGLGASSISLWFGWCWLMRWASAGFFGAPYHPCLGFAGG